jgi:two-component system, chemotaxis family, chemotaxis protein CheY
MRILAVEDEQEYVEMLREVLKSIGHTLTIASNGLEALKILEQDKVDVIMSDVTMPIMDGIEFHEKLRARPEYAKTPFIFLTGVNNLKKVRAVCHPDRDMLLQKPFPVDKLLKMFAGQIK